jgi:hypothetical protein
VCVLLVENVVQDVRFDLRGLDVAIDASYYLQCYVVIVFGVLALEYGTEGSFAQLFYNGVLRSTRTHTTSARVTCKLITRHSNMGQLALTSVLNNASNVPLIVPNFVIHR